MQPSEQICCPFCGQTFDVMIDTDQASQRFTVDCEICCRPMEVRVECEDGEVVSLEVSGN